MSGERIIVTAYNVHIALTDVYGARPMNTLVMSLYVTDTFI